MQKRSKRIRLSLKMKKNIVQIACAFVMAGTMGITLLEQSSEMKQKELLAQRENSVNEKKMEQTATSTKLFMDTSVVEDAAEKFDNTVLMDELSEDDAVVERERMSDAKSKQNDITNEAGTDGNQVSEQDGMQEQASQQFLDAKNDSVSEVGKKKTEGNRVVKNEMNQYASKQDAVEMAQEDLHLIERIFENHGAVPVSGECIQKYQFPVEIGYPIDKNYDGKNQPGDFILNGVYEVELNQPEDASSDEKETVSGDAVKHSTEGDLSDIKDEVSGDAVAEDSDAEEKEKSGAEVTKDSGAEEKEESGAEVTKGSDAEEKEKSGTEVTKDSDAVEKEEFGGAVTKYSDVEEKEKSGGGVTKDSDAVEKEESGAEVTKVSDVEEKEKSGGGVTKDSGVEEKEKSGAEATEGSVQGAKKSSEGAAAENSATVKKSSEGVVTEYSDTAKKRSENAVVAGSEDEKEKSSENVTTEKLDVKAVEISENEKVSDDTEKEVSSVVTHSAKDSETTIENKGTKISDEIDTISSEEKARQEKEQEKLEIYRKEVWSQILETEPSEVTQKQGSITVEEEPQVIQVSGDAGMTEDEETEAVNTEITAGYYMIKGKMREGSEVFVSDIQIIPTGVDGFDYVRIGEEGDFSSSLRITEDAVDKEIQLCFSDGEQITEMVPFTYSKDTEKPEVTLDEESFHVLESEKRTIYCTNDANLKLKLKDGDAKVQETLEQMRFLYGDKMVYKVDKFDEPVITLSDYYGRLLLNCQDKAGNMSDIQSQFVLVDRNAPKVTLAQDERCSAPYTLWTMVEETGHIVSGIQSVQCEVNGEIYEVAESTISETYRLDEGLDVSSKLAFPIELEETGTYTVCVRVTDYAGNETVVEQSVEVTEPDLVSVYMPKNFTIHIDPQQLAGREQIYSDDVTLKNVSDFDVRAKVDEIVLNVNDEVSDDGVKKDCDIYLVAPDTGERIKLSKGKNEDVYSYCLPSGEDVDMENLYFVGETTEGSERMWKGSDISLHIQLSFEKWDE